MNDLHAALTEYFDNQEGCGWHQDWPEALTVLRALLAAHHPVDRGTGPQCAGCATHITYTDIDKCGVLAAMAAGFADDLTRLAES